MEALTSTNIFERLCKAEQKWGLYISIGSLTEDVSNLLQSPSVIHETVQACPILDWNIHEHAQIILDGEGWFLFDTQEECEKAFWSTVGDDGPTLSNLYDGPMRVYALTCGPDGQLRNENT